MNNKPEIVFTFPACMGGVASFNYNIINYSTLISSFHSKVVLLKAKEDTRPTFLETFNADEVIIFNYSVMENQYYVRKRLNKFLGKKKGVIVTDNSLTIESSSQFKNPKVLVHLLHDYFYVNQTIHYAKMIDCVIAHSSFFSDAVYAYNPELFANRNFYIPYGVRQAFYAPVKNNKLLKLVFLGRLDKGKGVMRLKDIDLLLKSNNIEVEWSIIGKGPLKSLLHNQWEGSNNVTFHEPDSTEEVYNILSKQDIFVFPTVFEGTPVSILECLANGVITITNDLPGGIRDIISSGIGYRCRINDFEEYVKHITHLDSNRKELMQMQTNCRLLSTTNYDVINNADKYLYKFLEFETYHRDDKCKYTSNSRLDNVLLPNFIVIILRRLISLRKHLLGFGRHSQTN